MLTIGIHFVPSPEPHPNTFERLRAGICGAKELD
jgi:hypothetical protein